jgi:phage terminase large subunit GpA-like protein
MELQDLTTIPTQRELCREITLEAFSRTLMMKPPMSASQWADAHFYLSPESSGTEGKWECLPYQVGILDVCGSEEPRIVDLLKSARVGYTKMLDALVGYTLEHKRRNTVLYQPTDGDAKEFCKTEIDTMVRDVPVLATLAEASKNRKRDDTLTMKKLGNKILYVSGATSPARFRRITADTVLYDELDGFQHEIGDEGDPLKLGDRCITNSSFPKSIRGSTPTTKHGSLIYKEYHNAAIKFRYHVACPECAHMQPLEFKHFFWEKNGTLDERAATVKYVCCECKVGWLYSELWNLLESGEWRSDEGHRIVTGDLDPQLLDSEGMILDWPRHVAFHIWAAYSPFMSWMELIAEWLEAQGDYLKLKTFTNHRLGEHWEDEGETIDEHALFQKRESYKVPVDVLAVLASVDIQDNRVEIECAGFGYGEQSWHLEHHVIYGNTEHFWSDEAGELAPVWRDLNDYLITAKFLRDDGVILGIDAAGVDTGYRTETAYRFCAKCSHQRVFALKGIAGDGRAVVSAPTRQRTIDKEPIDLFGVGVDSAKGIVLKRLSNMIKGESPEIHLNLDFTHEHCEQITAEMRATKFRRGFEVREWIKTRPRNEMLDLWVYLLAVLYIVNPSWKALDEQRQPNAEKKVKPRTQGKAWATNW